MFENRFRSHIVVRKKLRGFCTNFNVSVRTIIFLRKRNFTRNYTRFVAKYSKRFWRKNCDSSDFQDTFLPPKQL